MDEQPPTKPEPSAEADHAPEPRHVEPAPIVGVAGRDLGRFVANDDGSVSWQRFRDYPPLGAELISLTRSAIAGCDGDPLEVAKTVIAGLPAAVRAKCKWADADPVEISRKIERHLPPPDGTGQGLRSEMIARRMALLEAHPNVEHIQGNTWRGSYADLDRFRVDLEAVDRANGDLLDEYEQRQTPGHPGPLKGVVLAILTGLGYPKPGNLYRDDRKPWTIPKARPK